MRSSMSELGKVSLSDEQRERILNERILPLFKRLEQGPLPEKPTLALVGGQPGSGKTGLLELATRDLAASGATWQINGDDFYAFHPRYAALQRSEGARAADLVKADANYWTAATLVAARQRGVHVAMETTMRQPALVAETLTAFKASGYATQVRVLAVKKEISWQGNHLRREMLSISGAATRLTDRDTHGAAYQGVLATTSALEASKLADRITVHLRGRGSDPAPTVFDSSKDAGAAARTIEEVRNKPLSEAGIRNHWSLWERVQALAQRRHGRDGVNPKEAASELTVIRADQVVDDHNLRGELTRLREANAREQQERNPASDGKELAKVLRENSREQAIKLRPELATVYALIDVAQSVSVKADAATKAKIAAEMRSRMADHLERGGALPKPPEFGPRVVGETKAKVKEQER